MVEKQISRGPATAAQSMSWNASHAAAWHKWFHVIEAGAQGLSDLMVARAGIAPSRRRPAATGPRMARCAWKIAPIWSRPAIARNPAAAVDCTKKRPPGAMAFGSFSTGLPADLVPGLGG